MIEVGIDTSVLIALLDPKDIWHTAATELTAALRVQGTQMAVFDCVLAEALSTMARRIHEQRRQADLDQLITRLLTDYPREGIVWLLPDVPDLYTEVLDLIRRTGGELNFNDALIALACRNLEVPYVASFDRDFDTIDWLTRLAKPEDLDFLLSNPR